LIPLGHSLTNAAPVIAAIVAAGLLNLIPRWIGAAAEAMWLGVLYPKASIPILFVFSAIAIGLAAFTGLPATSTLIAFIITPFAGVRLANEMAWRKWNSSTANEDQPAPLPPKGFLIAQRRRQLAAAFEPPPTTEL
jgi:hypothetical protein